MDDASTRPIIPDKRWVKKYPKLGTAPISAECFLSQTQFDLERERIFRRSWLNVGHACEIPEPGDYFVRRIEILRSSIIVVQGRDGIVRGVHNVCSHRGNALLYDERGNCKAGLTCNFHGWVYDSAGKLTYVPDESNFFDFDKNDHGLASVATDVWNGFIFVCFEPKQTLVEYLDGVAVRLKGGDWDQYRLQRTYRIDERSNWKVSIDAQNDGYHVGWQHRHLMPKRFLANDKGFGRMLDLDFYGAHSVSQGGINNIFTPTPLEKLIFGMEKGKPCRVPLKAGFEFWLLFPNFVMIFFRGPAIDACLTQNFWPLAVDRTQWEIRFYTPQPTNAQEVVTTDFFQVFNRVVFDEDATAHEWVFSGLESRAKTHFILQDEETPIRHFHYEVDSILGNAAGARP